MSAGQFTRGPWKRSKLFARIYITSPDGVVAEVNPAPESGSGDANADVIAAAPELVEALRVLVARDTLERTHGHHDYAPGSPVDKEWRAARDALAKALSVQPSAPVVDRVAQSWADHDITGRDQ